MNAGKFWTNAVLDSELKPMIGKLPLKSENWAEDYPKWVNAYLKPYLDEKGFHMADGQVKRGLRRKFINSLSKVILQKTHKVPATRELNVRLREHLWFKGKEIKLDDLREDFKEQDFKLKPEGNLDEIYDILSDASQLLDDSQQQRLVNLKRALSSRAKQRDVETKEISTQGLKRLSREIGEFDLGDFEDRKVVYDYWKRVSGDFEEFNKAKKGTHYYKGRLSRLKNQ